ADIGVHDEGRTDQISTRESHAVSVTPAMPGVAAGARYVRPGEIAEFWRVLHIVVQHSEADECAEFRRRIPIQLGVRAGAVEDVPAAGEIVALQQISSEIG